MLKVMDKVSVVCHPQCSEQLGWKARTLEFTVVARKSDGVVIRTRAVRDLERSPTVTRSGQNHWSPARSTRCSTS